MYGGFQNHLSPPPDPSCLPLGTAAYRPDRAPAGQEESLHVCAGDALERVRDRLRGHPYEVKDEGGRRGCGGVEKGREGGRAGTREGRRTSKINGERGDDLVLRVNTGT